MVDFEAFFRDIKPERMITQIAYQLENYKYYVYPAMSRIKGYHIETNLQIFDLTGGGVSKLASRNAMNLLKMGATMSQEMYPEYMGNCFIVNAPMTFVAMWTIIKGFLDERTR